MTAGNFLLILTGVLLNAAAQLLLKAGTTAVGRIGFSGEPWVHTAWTLAREVHILGGLMCYVISVGIWIVALSRVEVSVAYPMLSIGYIINAFAAYQLFGEALSAQKLLGIAVIMIGVWLIARS